MGGTGGRRQKDRQRHRESDRDKALVVGRQWHLGSKPAWCPRLLSSSRRSAPRGEASRGSWPPNSRLSPTEACTPVPMQQCLIPPPGPHPLSPKGREGRGAWDMRSSLSPPFSPHRGWLPRFRVSTSESSERPILSTPQRPAPPPPELCPHPPPRKLSSWREGGERPAQGWLHHQGDLADDSGTVSSTVTRGDRAGGLRVWSLHPSTPPPLTVSN